MPVPPVVMITCASPLLICSRMIRETSRGSSRTAWRPVTTCPPASSSRAMACPLVTAPNPRVSLTVRTKQDTCVGDKARCSETDINRYVRYVGYVRYAGYARYARYARYAGYAGYVGYVGYAERPVACHHFWIDDNRSSFLVPYVPDVPGVPGVPGVPNLPN